MSSTEHDMNRHVQLIQKLIHKRCGKHLKSNTVPGWYRSLSTYQQQAAVKLSDALRDDTEQLSTHRVARQLECLGLHPRPPSGVLRTLIRMSRGSDLAFLWFLMEQCYRSKNHGVSYNIHEQLIMSAIFRLDLYPTLRELERLLPPPNDSAKVRAKRAAAEAKAKEQQVPRRATVSKPILSLRSSKLAPYFQDPVLPKYHRPRLSVDYPARPAKFPVFQVDKEPRVWTRWFGNYKVSESKRVAQSLIYQEVNNILKSFKDASLRPKDVEVLCEHHKNVLNVENSLKANLEAIKIMECQKMADLTSREQERRKKRVLADLERMTECFEAQFHEEAVKTRLASVRKQLYARSKCEGEIGDYPPDFVFPSDPFGTGRLAGGGDQLEPNELKAKQNKTCTKLCHISPAIERCAAAGDGGGDAIRVQLIKDDGQKETVCFEDNKTMANTQNVSIYSPEKGLPEEKQCATQMKPAVSSLAYFLRCCPSEKSNKQRQNSDSEKSSGNLFELGEQSCNYQFNYRKLFNEESPSRLSDEQMRLKKAFIMAIDSDVETLKGKLYDVTDTSIDEVIAAAAQKIFQEDSEIFQREYELVARRKSKKIEQSRRLDFGYEYYDGDNEEQMKEMLRLTMAHIAKNHCYVVPSMPNVHCVPFLLEWISCRYGKTYSEKERVQLFERSEVIMRHLNYVLQREIVPPIRYSPIISNFKDYRCMIKIAAYLRQRASDLFCQSIMEVGRVFYLAMRHHLCSTQTFVDTFYAYMPSHLRATNFSLVSGFGLNRGRKQQTSVPIKLIRDKIFLGSKF